MSAADNDTEIANDANGNRPIFTIKDTKLYVPVVTFSVRDHQKLSKSLSKGFERSPKRPNKGFENHFIGINIKQKVISEIQQTNLDVLLEWIANKKW